ncbi:hypothetical protein ABW20_dc0108324 [Dactylellina cionopaga]|nr:hypothetical protein ABW20_dc0108324 [Dactylellina cionopaga]
MVANDPSPDNEIWQTSKPTLAQAENSWKTLRESLEILKTFFSPEVAKTFGLTLDLYDIAIVDLKFTGATISLYIQAESISGYSIEDVARHYEQSGEILRAYNFDTASTEHFQYVLWTRYPFLVLSGLAESKALPSPLGPDSEQRVVDFLEAAHKKGFVFGEESIAKLFTDPMYSDGLVDSFNPEDIEKLEKLLEGVQRLSYVTRQAKEIGSLLYIPVTSARAISRHPDFTAAALMVGFDDSTALRLQKQAQEIDRRNDQLWLDLLKDRLDTPLSAITNQNDQEESEDSNAKVNFVSLFKDTDSVHTEEVYSVTSASAYLVDLLEFLKESTIPKFHSGSAVTLQYELLRRRPDIGKLALSKDNTYNLISYSAIVQETIENFIFTLPHIESGSGAGDQDMYTYVYGTQLQSLVAPLPAFPYNDAVQTIRAFIEGAGVPLDVFQSSFRKRLSTKDQNKYLNYARQFNRQLAASKVNLNREEFGIIMGTPFMGQKDNNPLAGVENAGVYWGFKPADGLTANEIMVSEKGLKLIQQELLPRAGITFAEFIDVLCTKFMHRRLIVTSETGGFTEDLSQFRLQNSVIINRENTSAPLDETTCFDMQAFLRLRKVLNWTTENLDAALSALANIVVSGAHPNTYTISPETISGLAGISELSTKTGINVQTLALLWVDMGGFFDNKFYSQIFLREQILNVNPELSVDQSGRITGKILLADYYDILESLLGISDQQLKAILEVTGLQDPATLWTLQTISKIYRCQLQAKIFGYGKAEHYAVFEKILVNEFTSFSTPESTIAFYNRWVKVIKEPWTETTLLTAIQKTPGDQESNPTKLISFISALVNYSINGAAVDSVSDGNQEPPVSASRKDTSSSLEVAMVALFRQTKGDVLEYFLSRFLGDSTASSTSPGFVLSSEFQNLNNGSSENIPNDVSGVYALSPAKFRLKINCNSKNPPNQNLIQSTIRFKFANQIFNVESINVLEANPELPELALFEIISEELPIQQNAFTLLEIPDLVSDQISVQNISSMISKKKDDDDTSLIFFQKSFFDKTRAIFDRFTTTFDVVQRQQLQMSDIRSVFLKAIPWGDLRFKDLEKLKHYNDLRRLARGDPDKLEVCIRLCDTPTIQTVIGILPKILAETSGFPEKTLKDYISVIYGQLDDAELAKAFANGDQLLGIVDTMNMVKRCGMSGAPISQLVNWAHSMMQPTSKLEFEAVSEIRKFFGDNARTAANDHVLAKVEEALAPSRRIALSSFLLLHPTIQFEKITDMEDLSGFFLLDINMGPSFKTSRMKSAILTIQTFVQRCLLGLEGKHGIPTTAINQNSWSWMYKQNIWEACRKIFLYPENWADPSLRDDKSDQFLNLENKLSQNNITAESVTAAIREYIYTTHEIADLETQAYFFERAEGFRGIYHFFGRTRTTPYKIYYRRMTLEGPAGSVAEAYWYPWKRIEVEVPAQETFIDGTPLRKPGIYLLPTIYRSRLFLFMPYLTVKSKSKPIANVTVRESVGDITTYRSLPPTLQNMMSSNLNDTTGSNVQKYWELHMAWVELRNGNWTPKQISQSYITIEDSIDRPLPKPENFGFWIRDQNDGNIVAIDVAEVLIHPEGTGAAKTRPLGHFELTGAIMTAESPSFQQEVTLPTRFSKTDAATGAMATLYSGTGAFALSDIWPNDPPETVITKKKNMLLSKWTELMKTYQYGPPEALKRPIMTMPTFTDELLESPKHTLSWTFTFNETHNSRPLGLILERRTVSHTESYFGFPDVDLDGVIKDGSTETVTSQRLSHDISQSLVEKAVGTDIEQVYQVLRDTPSIWKNDVFGGDDSTGYYHELSTPFSIYNWELGFHIIMLLVEWLLAKQQYDLALRFAKLVFDPTRNDEAPRKPGVERSPDSKPDKPLSNLENCWQFHPFRNRKLRTSGSIRSIIERLPNQRGSSLRVEQWRKDPFNVHIIARGRPSVYMRRFVIKYIEILLAKGDFFFQDDSMESVATALQLFIEASHLFGPAPQEIPKPTSSHILTYNALSGQLNDFSTTDVDLELQFPYFSNPQQRSTPDTPPLPFSALQGITRTNYFGIATNPQIFALKERIDDRLFKIRNGLDINGNVRTLALYDPPLDPGQLIRDRLSGDGSGSQLFKDVSGPMPNYRFLWLLQKAFEMCNELKGALDSLLSVKEKKDAEALSLLRSRQDMKVQELISAIKDNSREECLKSLEVLQETRKAHVHRLQYYLALIGESSSLVPTPEMEWTEIEQQIDKPQDDELRMSPYEKLEMLKSEQSSIVGSIASGLDSTAAVLRALPHISENAEPLGCGITMKIDSHNVADFLSGSSAVIKGTAEELAKVANKASKKAQLVKQLQERRLQANLAGMDIKNCDKQIEAQKIRLKGIDREIALQEQQRKDSEEVNDFLSKKYTKDTLYDWMDKSIQKTSYDLFQLTVLMARKAEKAFFFERGRQPTTFLQAGYWSTAENGLTSAQLLHNDLRRIESAYIEKPAHDFEIVKSISMKQVSPLSLLKLRETGTTEFTIPEVLFDFDFPGHFGRRIKQVTITVPCIVSSYTSLSCDVRLLNHCYRLKAGGSSDDPEYYPASYDAYSTDARFATDNIPIKAIAMSGGQNDGGQFDLSFTSERYSPFEGAGVISRWKLTLPPKSMQQFEYRSISDVIFHVRYISLDGPTARDSAIQAVTAWQGGGIGAKPENGASFLCDLKNEFPSEWMKLVSQGPSPGAEVGANITKTFALQNMPRYLPYWANRDTTNIASVKLVLVGSSTEELTLASFEILRALESGDQKMEFQDGADEIEGALVRQSSESYAGNMPVSDIRLQITASDQAWKDLWNIWMVVAYKK